MHGKRRPSDGPSIRWIVSLSVCLSDSRHRIFRALSFPSGAPKHHHASFCIHHIWLCLSVIRLITMHFHRSTKRSFGRSVRLLSTQLNGFLIVPIAVKKSRSSTPKHISLLVFHGRTRLTSFADYRKMRVIGSFSSRSIIRAIKFQIALTSRVKSF